MQVPFFTIVARRSIVVLISWAAVSFVVDDLVRGSPGTRLRRHAPQPENPHTIPLGPPGTAH